MKLDQFKTRGQSKTRKNHFWVVRLEARLNSQFSRIAKISAYPSSGPASRPIPQEILRRWEQCAREGSLITSHAAGFNRCVSEIQNKMNQHISFLYSTIVKGKAPKEVTDAIKDLKDLSAFHTSVSVALGTAFQHLADSLFVQLANFILLRRDSYLEYVKPGLKPDTWNKVRNAPLFTYGLFPDDVLAVAEQDIIKHESARSASGSATFQHSKKHQFRYHPYDKKDNKQSGFSSQNQQPWCQFSGRGRGKSRGKGVSSSSYFSKAGRGTKQYKWQSNFSESPSSVKVKLWGSHSGTNKRQDGLSRDCKLSCNSCSYCKRAVTKERRKTLSVEDRNKICERCFVCKSGSLCPNCQKCPSCCQGSTCGRLSAKVLAGLALSEFKSKGSVHTKGKVFPTLQSKTPPPLSRS